MKIILYPEKENWEQLTKRPGIDKTDLEVSVRDILNSVRSEGDTAINYFSEKFGGAPPGNLKVSLSEILEASALVPDELKTAINIAKTNIDTRGQRPALFDSTHARDSGRTCGM